MAKQNHIFSNEDVEDLIQLTSMSSFPVILKLLKASMKGMETNLLTFDGEMTSVNVLATRSAKYQGAKQLYTSFTNSIEDLTRRTK